MTIPARRVAFILSCCLALPTHRHAWGQPLGVPDPGPFRVGFRSVLLHDAARRDYSARGPRVVPLYLWYPSRAVGAGPARFGLYLDRLGEWVTDRAAAGDSVFAARAVGLGGARDVVGPAMPGLRARAAGARPDAPPAPGRHPVVLFPEYTTPATASLLAEYLASHGFVVASVPLRGAFRLDPEISMLGLDALAQDLSVAIRALDSMRLGDLRRIGGVGVGIVASGLLALQLESGALGAMVSLEGGITTAFETDMLRRSPYFDVAALAMPLLAIHAPHPTVDVRRLDAYPYAPQVRIHYPRMGEFWFLSYGRLEAVIPGLIGTPPGDPVAGFDAAARQVREFFEATLGGGSLDAFTAGVRSSAAGGLFSVEERPAVPVPPSVAELQRIAVAAGGDGLLAALRARRAVDPAILPDPRFNALIAGLGGGGDAGYGLRGAVAALWREAHPGSARARRVLALAALARADTAAARAALADALARLEDDPAPDLEWRGARRQLRDRLRSLADSLGG